MEIEVGSGAIVEYPGVHLFAYCLLLFKNETLITIHPIHMPIKVDGHSAI